MSQYDVKYTVVPEDGSEATAFSTTYDSDGGFREVARQVEEVLAAGSRVTKMTITLRQDGESAPSRPFSEWKYDEGDMGGT